MAGGVFNESDAGSGDANGADRQPASNVSSINRQQRQEPPKEDARNAPEGKGGDGKPVMTEDRRTKVEAIKTLMESTGSSKEEALKFYNHEGPVSTMPDDKLDKLHAQLVAKKRRMDAMGASKTATAA
jgi:hypothetical protein